MAFLSFAIFLAFCLTYTLAVDVVVQSTGGNATGKFGHPFGYGFLHEDINNSGDGGIYAELIQNRAFQGTKKYPASTAHYSPINGASLSLEKLKDPLSKIHPWSMRVAATADSKGDIGFKNHGYWGIGVSRQTYTGSFWVQGPYSGSFTVSLESNLTGEVFGTTKVASRGRMWDWQATWIWTEYTFHLVPSKDAPNSNNSFSITFDPAATTSGWLDFGYISLFPPTYKNRKNGLRLDLAEALADMNPTFLRFPGGNMLEGSSNDTRWFWKDSLGPVHDRPGFSGTWGYPQTHGLGLMEYLEWAEDMNLQIVLAVWAGLSLNGDVTPVEKLQHFVDDALDEIEFVTGPADSEWGALRAQLGHPEPFELNYVEIGNEEWLAGYPNGWDSYKMYRFTKFHAAIHDKYPNMQIIASAATSDPAPEGSTTGPNTTLGMYFPQGVIGDYHPYREPDELVEEFSRFDNDIGHIVGEVAATHVNGATPPRWEGQLYKYPWWIGAVGEAISLIGYERNSDRIPGAFYAPVLKNENRFQWPITLIQFTADPKQTTKAVTWYCWSLFAHHPISHTLPTFSNSSYGPLYWVAGKDEKRPGALVWKGAAYNTTNGAPVPVSVQFQGVKPGSKANLTVLTNSVGDPYAYNDPKMGINIVNTTTVQLMAGNTGAFEFSLPQLSIAVLDTDPGIPADSTAS